MWVDPTGKHPGGVECGDHLTAGAGLDAGWSAGAAGLDVDEGHPGCGEHVQVVLPCGVGPEPIVDHWRDGEGDLRGKCFTKQASGVVVHDSGGELVQRVKRGRTRDDLGRWGEPLGLSGLALLDQHRESGGFLDLAGVHPAHRRRRRHRAHDPARFDRQRGDIVEADSQRCSAGDEREMLRHRLVQHASANRQVVQNAVRPA